MSRSIDNPDQDSFADHPVSLSEVRSDKSQNASEWTPRDALIATLRSLDAGEITPDALVVAWVSFKEGGKAETAFNNASPNIVVAIGLLESAKIRLWEIGE
jgi:hypothetical protein